MKFLFEIILASVIIFAMYLLVPEKTLTNIMCGLGGWQFGILISNLGDRIFNEKK